MSEHRNESLPPARSENRTLSRLHLVLAALPAALWLIGVVTGVRLLTLGSVLGLVMVVLASLLTILARRKGQNEIWLAALPIAGGLIVLMLLFLPDPSIVVRDFLQYYPQANLIKRLAALALFILLALWILMGRSSLLRGAFLTALGGLAISVFAVLLFFFEIGTSVFGNLFFRSIPLQHSLPRLIVDLSDTAMFALLAWFCWRAAAEAGTQKAVRRASAGSNQKSKNTAAILAFFLGGMGVHNFYLGYPGRGIAQIIVGPLAGILGTVSLVDYYSYYRRGSTPGLAIFLFVIVFGAGIWVLVDFIRILTQSLKPANGPYREQQIYQQQRQLYQQQQAARPVSVPQPARDEKTAALDALGALRAQGVLSDEEYLEKTAEVLRRHQRHTDA